MRRPVVPFSSLITASLIAVANVSFLRDTRDDDRPTRLPEYLRAEAYSRSAGRLLIQRLFGFGLFGQHPQRYLRGPAEFQTQIFDLSGCHIWHPLGMS